jgi:hypothetical protein
MITPGLYNMTCYQGATFNPIFVSTIDDTPVNYTGYTGKMQVRRYQKDDSDLIITFSTASNSLSLTSAGWVAPYATAAQTTALEQGNFFYDIELTDSSGVVTRYLQGRFTVDGQVTA